MSVGLRLLLLIFTIITTDFEEMAKPVAADTAPASSTNDTATLKEEI